MQILDTAILIALVVLLTQALIKPLVQHWLADTDPVQNQAIRLCAFVLAYGAVILNGIDPKPLSFALARALLPTAFVVWSGALAAYHTTTGALPNVRSLMRPGAVDASPPLPRLRQSRAGGAGGAEDTGGVGGAGRPSLWQRIVGLFRRQKPAQAPQGTQGQGQTITRSYGTGVTPANGQTITTNPGSMATTKIVTVQDATPTPSEPTKPAEE